MLESQDALAAQLLALPPVKDQLQGVTNFVNVIANFTNQVQAGSSGSVGILTFSNAAMIAILMTQQPVGDNSWIPKFADAWYAGVASGTITPGTVTDATWDVSIVDIDTSPSPAATITTLSAAKSLLMSELAQVVPTQTAPILMAKAIRDATLAFTFLCIGLKKPPPTGTDFPISFPAQ